MTTTTQIPDITDPKVRLGVYERALEAILKNSEDYGLDGTAGLCMWLPRIWLNPSGYLSDWIDHKGKSFSFPSAPKYFPEFGQYYPSNNYEHERHYRISILTQIIKNLKEKV